MIAIRRFSSKITRTPEQIEKGIEKVQKFKKFVNQPGMIFYSIFIYSMII